MWDNYCIADLDDSLMTILASVLLLPVLFPTLLLHSVVRFWLSEAQCTKMTFLCMPVFIPNETPREPLPSALHYLWRRSINFVAQNLCLYLALYSVPCLEPWRTLSHQPYMLVSYSRPCESTSGSQILLLLESNRFSLALFLFSSLWETPTNFPQSMAAIFKAAAACCGSSDLQQDSVPPIGSVC